MNHDPHTSYGSGIALSEFWAGVYARANGGERLGQAMFNLLSERGMMPAHLVGTSDDPFYTVTTEWQAMRWVNDHSTLIEGIIVRIGV